MTNIQTKLRRFKPNVSIPMMMSLILLSACGTPTEEQTADAVADADTIYEKGPHGGRLLTDGPLALEITIFEAGTPPRFHVYPFADGEPADPKDVTLVVELTRLGGSTDMFTFRPRGAYLAGDGIVVEPHSFDVRVAAAYRGRRSEWTYQSHEGRTTIFDEVSDEMGIATEPAGAATLYEALEVLGRVDLAPGAQANLRAKYPGQVLGVDKAVGAEVRAGERLASIESSQSLRRYEIVSPIDGVVLERHTNVGDVADRNVLFVVGDITRLQVDFHVFPKDLSRVSPGQTVAVTSVDDRLEAETQIQTFLPTKELETQTVIARALLANPERTWMPGMTVQGNIVVSSETVPLAVRTQALQRFRDFNVVFAKIGETYEVRMLDLGRQTPEWTEVTGGIRPGQDYVTRNSFLIKADIEKSGASHDH